MEISKRITHFRTLKGYSVNKLANLSGISQSYLREVELGNKNPTVEILSLLCDTLDISLKDFFDDQLSNDFFRDPLIADLPPFTRTAKRFTPFSQSNQPLTYYFVLFFMPNAACIYHLFDVRRASITARLFKFTKKHSYTHKHQYQFFLIVSFSC